MLLLTRQVTFDNFHKRYVTFEVVWFAILGFSNMSADQISFFCVVQNM